MYRYFLFAVVANAANVSFIDFDACEFPTNTPDRVKWLDLLVVDTQQAFLKYQIQTWITQSTLLGLVRDGATMPWTWDTDISLFSANLSFICNKTGPVRLDLERKGYRIYDCLPNFARVCRVRQTPGKPKYISTGEPVESRLDLYGATLRPDGLYNVCFSNCLWNFSYLFPLREYSWTAQKNVSALGPRNYEYWLQYSYGPNWTTPDTYGGGRTDLCVYEPSKLRRSSDKRIAIDTY